MYRHSETGFGCLLMKPLRLLIVTEVVTMSVPLFYSTAHCVSSDLLCLSFTLCINVHLVTDLLFILTALTVQLQFLPFTYYTTIII